MAKKKENLPQKIRNILESREDVSVLDYCEVVNEDVLLQGAIHYCTFIPLHYVNIAIVPGEEIWDPVELNKWLKRLIPRMKGDKSDFNKYKLRTSEFYKGEIVLKGLTMGYIELTENVGCYKRKVSVEHCVILNDGVLAGKLGLERRRKVFREEFDGLTNIGGEDRDGSSKIFNDLERRILISPYLNEDHFESVYYGKGGHRSRFRNPGEHTSGNLYYISETSVSRVLGYLSCVGKERFMKYCDDLVKSGEMKSIEWDK